MARVLLRKFMEVSFVGCKMNSLPVGIVPITCAICHAQFHELGSLCRANSAGELSAGTFNQQVLKG